MIAWCYTYIQYKADNYSIQENKMLLNENHLFDHANREYKNISNIELGDEITLMAGQITAATYCFLKMLAEFDRRKGWDNGCIRSCSHWLSLNCGMTATTAREKLRVAHCLEKLPNINKEFESGKLSYSKVRAMTRVATDDNEDILLSVAIGGTASHIEKLVRRYQLVDENQNPVEQGDEYQQRKLDYYQDDEGMWILHAKLPQLEGGLLVKAIEEIIRQQDKNHSEQVSEKEQNASAEAPGQEQDASTQVPEKEQNASAEAPGQEQISVPVVEKASYSQKRGDALASLAEHYIATATVDDENGGVQALAGHERCQVVLHLSVDTLEAEAKPKHEHGESCHYLTPPNVDYQWISIANAKRFSSDASLYTVLEDKYGNVLNVGRKTRTVGTALKRALDLRDEICRFPGCCANKYVDFHHIKHWADGGETEPDNLIKLCRFHHAQLHKGHYAITVQQQTQENNGQKWEFETAAGEIINPNPTPLPITTNKDFLGVQWPNIDSRTGVSSWRGEPLNYSEALGDLLWCKHRNFDNLLRY
ncbi:MAG: hypothetical protein ACI8WB_000076 [Phenylobacterium sp.]|jgi:hypothetical protein